MLIYFSFIVKEAILSIEIMLKYVPGTNQYWAIRVKCFAHGNDGSVQSDLGPV